MASTEESARCVTSPEVSSHRMVERNGSRNGRHELPGTYERAALLAFAKERRRERTEVGG
eukprot:scaffold109965_cov28-Tisochrysis_lutea.AAC.9